MVDLTGHLSWFCPIVDFGFVGLGLGHRHALSHLRAVIGVSEANYPETMAGMVIINAPSIFPFFWKIVKPWLDEYTASKVTSYLLLALLSDWWLRFKFLERIIKRP